MANLLSPDLNDLSVLPYDINPSGLTTSSLYDLTNLTFQYSNNQVMSYVVQPQETMRIDSVCNSIYTSINYMDFLTDLNDIDNPLNIMAGDIINYVDVSQISLYQITTNNDTATQQTLLNANKTTQTDSNRQAYIQNNYSLAPTFLQNPSNPVQISGNNVIISSSNGS